MVSVIDPVNRGEKWGRRRGDLIPGPASLLRWVYVGRVSVAIAILISAGFYFGEISSGVMLTVAAAAVLSVAMTAASAFLTHVQKVRPRLAFLYVQVFFDLALVTTVVHLTGGVSSDFASLYILVIAVAAVTMPFPSTLLVTVVAGAVYFTASLWGTEVELSVAVFLQIGVFAAVALATGWLASRVRVVGAHSRALAREVNRLRLEAGDILREISGGVVTVAGDGTLVFANASAERLLGFDSRDFLQKPVLEFLGERSPELRDAISETQRGRRRQLRAEGTIDLPDTAFPIGLTTTQHRVMDGDLPSVTAIFSDISAQKRLNELHLRAERLEAVAALSASLAHEIKNPLASIRSSVEQLGRSARAEPDDRFLAELVVRESDRLSRLLTEFLDFSRVQMTDEQMVDLNAIARMAVDLVREHPDCPPNARVEVKGATTRLKGDEDLLHRVVVNLVLNALQASKGEASVSVCVRSVTVSELPSDVSSDMSVVLEVSDDGPGIPDHIRDRLFDPFVTAREGGTGLGLAIVQRAVEAHHGLVFVESEEGVGTTFRIYLPVKGATEVAA